MTDHLLNCYVECELDNPQMMILKTLKSREIDVNDPNYPGDILHVFAYNLAVNNHNKKKTKHDCLKRAAGNNSQF